MGGVTALGDDWPTIRGQFAAGRTGVRRMAEWDRFTGVNTRLGAPVPDFSAENRYPRRRCAPWGGWRSLASPPPSGRWGMPG